MLDPAVLDPLVLDFIDPDSSDQETPMTEPDDSPLEVVIGATDAPHTLTVFEDFLCPYCAMSEQPSRERLAALAAQGRVRVSYRPLNLLGGDDPESYSARSVAALYVVLDEAGVAAAKDYHDHLYADPPPETGPYPTRADLAHDVVASGALTSAEAGPIQQRIQSGDGADRARAATVSALRAGVEGTPTVLLDGRAIVDYRTVEELVCEIVAAVS